MALPSKPARRVSARVWATTLRQLPGPAGSARETLNKISHVGFFWWGANVY